jgi:hypothetical protein
MKLMLSILDLLLRVAAGVTVLAICLLALFVGGMAGLVGLFAIVLPTLVLSVWVVLCAFSPSTISRMLPDSAAWRFVLMKLPVYAVACVGIYGGVYQWRVRYSTPSVMVSESDRQFPKINPSSNKVLEISGTLPLTVPVKELLAIYAADANSAQSSSKECTRRQDFMPKNDTTRYPLVHIEHIPMVRTAEAYRSSVAIDRFDPGVCGWHFKAVTFLLDVKGYSEKAFAYWRASSPHVEFLTQPQAEGERSDRSAVHRGRADVWCWKVTNHEYNPFLPVRCGDITDALKWPGQHVTAAVSVAERHSAGIAYAGPESSYVEFNFHDLDAPQSQLTEPLPQLRKGATPPSSGLSSPAPSPSQFTESPTQVESPTTPTGNLPSPLNGDMGRSVNISIGDSLENVRTALGFRGPLEPARSPVHANSQSLALRDRGVRVFFDESNKVYVIRIDAPFTGKVGGTGIIRTREELDRAPGAPVKRIEALSSLRGSSFISDIDASTKARYDFDAEGKLITVFLLSGTMQINLGGS